MADRANWAALVPYEGIQNLPASLKAIGEVSVATVTVTVPLAKLSVTGVQGSMTFINGLFDATSYKKPT